MYEVDEEDLNQVKGLIKDNLNRELSEFYVESHLKILDPVALLLAREPDLKSILPGFLRICKQTIETFERGNKLFVGGNGGSMADAQHIVGELNKSFNRKRPISEAEKACFTDLPGGKKLAEKLEWGLPAIALGTNSSVMSAISNDINYNLSFAQELYALGNSGDEFLAISTSGNSKNIISAMKVALAEDMKTASLTGQTGGKLADLSKLIVKVPAENTDVVQEFHQSLYHCLCGVLEEYFHFNER